MPPGGADDSAGPRTWTSTDGRSLVATLRTASETEVQLLRSDGLSFTLPLTALSEADRRYVAAYREKMQAGAASAADAAARLEGLRDGPYADLIRGEWVKTASAEGMPFQIYGDKRKLRSGKLYPLAIYLHGANARGSDNDKALEPGATLFADEKFYDERPCFVIAPQCPADRSWGQEMASLRALIHHVTDHLPVDRDRIYVTGYSMGSRGSWALMAEEPGLIAAAVPVASGGDVKTAASLVDIPIWAFNGELDSPEETVAMADAIKAAGGTRIKVTIIEGADHLGQHHKVARDPEVHEWLFDQSRAGRPE